MTRIRLVVALLAVLAVAGCQAPMAEPQLDGSIAVEGENISVSPESVYAGVRTVADADVSPPERIDVLPNASAFRSLPGFGAGSLPPFYELVGFHNSTVPDGSTLDRMENGATYNTGLIYILPAPDGDPASTEWVLAHEFGHYVNLQLGRVTDLGGKLGSSTDEAYVAGAIREGATVFTTDTYLQRYGNRTEPTAPMYERLIGTLPAGEYARFGLSKYVHGYRYVSSRVEDPSGLDNVFEQPPTTSEQLLHGYAPGEEPPAELNVTVEATETWGVSGTDRLGEAFVRYALENGVDSQRAADAAAGWGVDRLYYLRPASGGNTSYAWTFRWDDAANASAFERTVEVYFEERADRHETGWKLANTFASVREPTDRTTVLLFGNRSLVSETESTATGQGQVHIGLPEKPSVDGEASQ
ncbi:hypothetical protein [Halorhabdus sp. CUG00001]|uniref:hypothetical protein n=1 Tax=Halorhabdus sp. CUG00001 TaxID=2600297 RepID=UPI00131C880A|nr:hypothetical protein [Halorhabdus sp. CUG00001]